MYMNKKKNLHDNRGIPWPLIKTDKNDFSLYSKYITGISFLQQRASGS